MIQFFVTLRPLVITGSRQLSHLDFRKADYTAIAQQLALIDWSMLFASCTDIDELRDVFVNQIQRLILQCVPFSRRDVRRQNNRLPRDIKRLIRKKRQAWKRCRHSPTDDSKQRFCEISCLCKQVMRAHVAKEEDDLLNMNAKHFLSVRF